MTKDVMAYMKACHKFQIMKPLRQKSTGLFTTNYPNDMPFIKLVLDYLGPRLNRKQYILVATDSTTTMYAIVKAMEKADAQTMTKFVLILNSK